MNTFFYFLEIVGCLGVFLYGMKVLSEGIQKTAGDRLRRILATMTKNRLSGVGTGFLSTVALQSSSATTVIVVSFVNTGLLTLIESISVIMGANLGTTVTAWMIAAVGKFSLSRWALPIIGVGLPLIFMGRGRAKNIGEICIGFGLLFFGLGLLKDAVPDVRSLLLSDDPKLQAQAQWWKDFITSLGGKGHLSLLLFLAGGVVLTLLVQSSSAAMAITITLALRGWIGFEESCAIVLGENIGTTVTAYLASLGAGVQAKRAARAHFLFNIIGVVWMMIVFYPFTKGVFWLGEHLPASFRVGDFADAGDRGTIAWNLAIFHSLFNFANILLLIGFVPLIGRLVTRWVKDKSHPGQRRALPFITQALVDGGELNFPEAERAVNAMGKTTYEMLERFQKDILVDPPADLGPVVAALKHDEEDSDAILHDITNYLVRCSTSELSSPHAAAVSSMLRGISELEEVADCLYRAAKLTERHASLGFPLPDAMREKLAELTGEALAFLSFANRRLTAIASDEDLARARQMEANGNRMRAEITELAMERVKADGNVQLETIHMDIARELEKATDHLLVMVEASHERVLEPARL